MVGQHEVKDLTELLPEILKQVGPQQFGFLKDLIAQSGVDGQMPGAAESDDEDDDDDDAPPLVEGNFEIVD